MIKKRIGILGGMGPLAGVRLQELIIKRTPAMRDQDHYEVVCFSNPSIPDRTHSLEHNAGVSYCTALIDSLRLLEKCEITTAVIACNTSHACMESITRVISVPLVHMPKVTMDFVTHKYGAQARVLLLATRGTYSHTIFEKNGPKNINWVYPNNTERELLMDSIYAIKAGKVEEGQAYLEKILEKYTQEDIDTILFGCTELSLLTETMRKKGFVITDPLEVAAGVLVQ